MFYEYEQSINLAKMREKPENINEYKKKSCRTINEQIRFLYDEEFSIKEIVDILHVPLETVLNVCSEMMRHKMGFEDFVHNFIENNDVESLLKKLYKYVLPYCEKETIDKNIIKEILIYVEMIKMQNHEVITEENFIPSLDQLEKITGAQPTLAYAIKIMIEYKFSVPMLIKFIRTSLSIMMEHETFMNLDFDIITLVISILHRFRGNKN